MIEREWYDLAGAAARIGGTEDDVLHLAAIERLRLCYLMRAVPANEYFYDRQRRELLNTDCVPFLHGLVGLTAYCAGVLEIWDSTTANYFLNLSKPDYEWCLLPAAATNDRPEIAIRDKNVVVTIRRDEVVVRAVDLQTFETAKPTHVEIGRDHVSDQLAKLNQAAEKFWKNASREDRGTHPKNAAVAQWLIENAAYTPSLADKAATIIRPHWAPVGRKPDE